MEENKKNKPNNITSADFQEIDAFDNLDEVSLFSATGAAGGIDGAAVTTANKDILITPGSGGTLNQISQIDFKHVRATPPTDISEPQDGEIKVSIYPYGERKSGDAYDSPVLVIGGTWNGVRYAPSVDYISGASSTVAPIWIHPRSGKIEATLFSAPSAGFNGIGIYDDTYKFTLKGGKDVPNSVPSELVNVEFITGTSGGISTFRFDQSSGDDTTHGDLVIYYGNASGGHRTITFNGDITENNAGNWTFNKSQASNDTTVLNFVGGSTAQNILSTNATVTPVLGDMYYAPTPGTYYTTLTRLAIGTRSSVLVANSASPIPTWLAPSTTGHTLIGSTTGDATWAALGIVGGGTGVTSAPTIGQLLWGNNASGYTLGVLAVTSPITLSTNGTTGQGTIGINATNANTNNFVVQRDGSGGFSAGTIVASAITLTTGTISTAPSGTTDIVNKAYVDALAQGIDIRASCRVATAAALSTHSFSSGVMTNTAVQAALVIDGVTVTTNDRVLVKNEGSGTSLQNGIYTVTNTGSGATDWVLTRADDANTSAEVTSGIFTFIEEGTINADSGWVLSTNNPITLDTTTLTFTQFSGAGAITAGSGLNSSGTTIAANIYLDNSQASNQIRFRGGSGTNDSASAGNSGTSVTFDIKTTGTGVILLEGKADGFELTAGATGRKLTVKDADKILAGTKTTLTLGGSGTDGITINTNADGFDISAGTTARTLTITSGGNLTLTSGSNNPNITIPNLATSTMVVNNGGAFTQYGVLFSSVATNGVTLSTAQGASGQPLIGQGAANPVFGSVDVTSYATGTLPIANGGTNNNALTVTAGQVVYADGTKLISLAVPTSNANAVLYYVSSAPAWSGTTTTGGLTFQSQAGGIPQWTNLVTGGAISAGTGITISTAAPAVVAIDQAFTPTWTGAHIFRGNAQQLTIQDSADSNVARYRIDMASGQAGVVLGKDITSASAIQPFPVSFLMQAGGGTLTEKTIVKISTTAGAVVNTTTGENNLAVGVLVTGNTIGNAVRVARLGRVTVTADTTAVAVGDYLICGASGVVTGGNASAPTSGGWVGRALTAKAGGAPGDVDMLLDVGTADIGGSGTQYNLVMFSNASGNVVGNSMITQNAGATEAYVGSGAATNRLIVGGATSASALTLNSNGQTTAAYGITFGTDGNNVTLYRSANDTLKTDDSLIIGTNLSVLNGGIFTLYESGSVNFNSFVTGTQAVDLNYTLPTTQPSTNQVLAATAVAGAGPYDITLGWATPSASVAIGGTVTSGTAGSLLFVGTGPVLAQDNANLYWDDTNNTFGVGTTRTGAISGTNPSFRVKGTGTTSSTSAFEVQGSTSVVLFFVRDDGLISLGTKGSYTESTGRMALTTTGSGGGVMIGGDALLYRDTADVLRTPDSVVVDATLQALRVGCGAAASATSALLINQNFNTFPASSTRFSFDVTTNGTVASGGAGSLRTLNFTVQGNGGETFTEITCFNSAAYSNSTVTVSNLVGYTNQCVVSNSGLVSAMYGYRSYFSCASASGGGATNARHFEVRAPNFGTSGNFTAHAGLYVSDLGHATRVTNAYGVFIAGQTASATASYGIYFNGTSGAARDGITWNADTNLYRSAANVLKTDDSLLVSLSLAAGVATLSDGATPALNAALGNTFLLTAAGDRTIGIPTNPTSGQRIIIVHKASAADRTLALNTGTGGFRFGSTITALTATLNGLTDYIEAIYNAADNKWDVVDVTKGF